MLRTGAVSDLGQDTTKAQFHLHLRHLNRKSNSRRCGWPYSRLRQNLRIKVGWDESKIDRLIEYERERLGNVPLQTLMGAPLRDGNGTTDEENESMKKPVSSRQKLTSPLTRPTHIGRLTQQDTTLAKVCGVLRVVFQKLEERIEDLEQRLDSVGGAQPASKNREC